MSSANDSGEQDLGTEGSRYTRLMATLRYPDFRVLWISTVSNQLGQGIQHVVLGWMVFNITDSGGMVGVIFALRSAPNLIVGFAAGSITDWLDRRTLMRVVAWGQMLVSIVLALLAFSGRLELWHLMFLTFVLGTFHAFWTTARQVYVYDIVGPAGLMNGLALTSLAQRVGGISGALIAGVLIGVWGSGSPFFAMAVSYAVGAIILYQLRYRGESAPEVREPILQNAVNYLRTLRTNKTMLSLMVSTAAAEALGFSHQVVLPILAKDVLHVGAIGLGVLTAFRFVGGALGVVFLTVLGEVRRRGALLLTMLVLFAVGQMMLSQSPNFWMALLLVALVNLIGQSIDILHHVLLQFSVANEQRGRAMGSWIVGIGTAPLGQLEVGYLAGATGARTALLANGIALAAVSLVLGLLLPRLRRL